MVARVWVGGASGDWTTASNWSPSGVPTPSDDVTFTAGSSASVSIGGYGVISYCNNFTIPPGFNLTLTGLNNEFRIHGNFTNSGTLNDNRTSSTFESAWHFHSLAAGSKTINFGSHTLQNSIFINTDYAAASWSLSNNLTSIKGITFRTSYQATFTTNNYNITAYRIEGSDKTTLFLGSSAISVEQWSFGFSSSLATVNAGTSTITFTGREPYFGAGGKTYHNIVFAASLSYANANVPGLYVLPTLYNFTCNNLTLSAPPQNGWRTYWFASGCTVTGTLTAVGASVSRRILFTTTLGATISAATRNISDADFLGITWSGAALTGTRLGNCNGNSNITFAAPKTVYWSGYTGGSWFDNRWALTSGGTANVANFPLAQDTVVFDTTSQLGTEVILIDTGSVAVGNISITTTSPWTLKFYDSIYLFGTSFSNNGTATISRQWPTSAWYFQPADNFTLTLNGKQLDANVFFMARTLDLEDIRFVEFRVPAETITSYVLSVFQGLFYFPVGTMTVGEMFVENILGTGSLPSLYLPVGASVVCTNGRFYSTTDYIYRIGPSLSIYLTNSSSNDKQVTAQGFASTGAFYGAPDVYVTAGSGTFEILGVTVINNLDLTGFSGNFNCSRTDAGMVGNVIFGSGMTGASGYLTIAAYYNKSITFDSKGISITADLIIGYPYLNGYSFEGLVTFVSNVNCSSTLTHTSGKLDLNGYTVTANRYAAGDWSPFLIFSGSNLILTGTAPIGSSTNFGTAPGSGSTIAVISLTNANTKTIRPSFGSYGDRTWWCIIRNTGAGEVKVANSGTYIDWENTYTAAPVTYTITTGTTQRFLKDLSLKGTSGTSKVNLVAAQQTIFDPTTFALVKPNPWAVGVNSTLTGTTGITATENNMGRDHLTITNAVASSSPDETSGFLIYTI